MGKKSLMALVACLGALAVLVAPAAQAGDIRCSAFLTGAHDNIIVKNGDNCHLFGATVRGNVKVLSGGGLVIENSTVRGSVQAEEGHRYLAIAFMSEIGGDVTAKGTTSVPLTFATENYLCNSHFKGNVLIELSSASSPWSIGSFRTCSFGNRIDGNLNVFKNKARIEIDNNTFTGLVGPVLLGGIGKVRENIHFEENSTSTAFGPHTIRNNHVEEDVQVFKNMGGILIIGNTIGENLQCKENVPLASGGGNMVGGNRQCEGVLT